ncbi:hypothetical protein GCM10007285_31530 [Stappia taiwanensis]|nr:hypothetical protein GCM10007285_31530 [Stappia taiwanensis]
MAAFQQFAGSGQARALPLSVKNGDRAGLKGSINGKQAHEETKPCGRRKVDLPFRLTAGPERSKHPGGGASICLRHAKRPGR